MQLRLSRRHFLATGAIAIAGACLPATPAIAGQRSSESPAGTDAQTIEDVVAANRILAQQGVLDGFGHVSARHPRTADRFLLARSIAPELVTAPDIMEYDLEGRAIDPRGRDSYQERFIHSEIYRARADVNAIVPATLR